MPPLSSVIWIIWSFSWPQEVGPRSSDQMRGLFPEAVEGGGGVDGLVEVEVVVSAAVDVEVLEGWEAEVLARLLLDPHGCPHRKEFGRLSPGWSAYTSLELQSSTGDASVPALPHAFFMSCMQFMFICVHQHIH
nr:hypothetical protein Iba_chr01dCG8310 [Ipomoea batatas]